MEKAKDSWSLCWLSVALIDLEPGSQEPELSRGLMMRMSNKLHFYAENPVTL